VQFIILEKEGSAPVTAPAPGAPPAPPPVKKNPGGF
jgi:hypothetical protein